MPELTAVKYLNVTITPETATALHNVLSKVDRNSTEYSELNTWLAYVNQSLYKAWLELPDGDHLKAAYADQVWTWDDQDIA